MTHFDAAVAAVEAATAAGARYADARVMVHGYESVTARNGEIDELTQTEDAGIGVRALVGNGWGFASVPDMSDRAARAAGVHAAQIARASAATAGPAARFVPAPATVASWSSACVIDPLSVPLGDRVGLLVDATVIMQEHGADLGEGLYQIWD